MSRVEIDEIGEAEPMYVLTNQMKYFGAAGIFLCAEMFQKHSRKTEFLYFAVQHP